MLKTLDAVAKSRAKFVNPWLVDDFYEFRGFDSRDKAENTPIEGDQSSLSAANHAEQICIRDLLVPMNRLDERFNAQRQCNVLRPKLMFWMSQVSFQ